MFSPRSLVLAAFLACSAAAAVAQPQTLPANRFVTYAIHETPGDETTPLQWTVQVFISAFQRNGDNVAWRISKVKITDVANGRVWVDNIPVGELGNWWVAHAEPLQPAAGEFGNLPHLVRQAVAQGTGYNALDYNIQGDGAASTAVWISYWWKFQMLQTSSPQAEEEEKPVFVTSVVDYL